MPGVKLKKMNLTGSLKICNDDLVKEPQSVLDEKKSVRPEDSVVRFI